MYCKNCGAKIEKKNNGKAKKKIKEFFLVLLLGNIGLTLIDD